MIEVEVEGGAGDFRLDVAFQTRNGVTAVYGHSGAGKTTLVAMIAGLIRPRRGRIALDGRTLFDAKAGVDLPASRRRIGYVFQEARLFPHLSVDANLLYGAKLSPEPPSTARVAEVVDLLGIAHLRRRRPRTLSGGEAQRVAIGRALLANPKALILDEPLASLDAARKREILPYLERLRAEKGLPILYVSHALDEVARLASDMVLLSDGRLMAAGPIETVLARLDLRPLTGRFQAGALIEGVVAAHDAADGLSEVAVGGQRLVAPLINAGVGAPVRLRVRARDVALALRPPEDCSIQNVLRGTITAQNPVPPGIVEFNLDVEGQALSARITARSARTLGLKAGTTAYALIKSIALDRGSVAGGG